ncbi:hypothetical protein V1260_03420 [Brachybacterium sp. J144]|uniref:hypothetical protein n=1 Tax=unclassified Brachybacterium TaxID=2623841 RepID=UPI002E775657|nr:MULTISPECIES: hypothetical protein [unclassified Brachybacterium]MEE1617189.1 hypothetical protein [Brachybacterium sp. J153]MEE1649830.1 hypothetical protein [Brachybacterium sp. J144]
MIDQLLILAEAGSHSAEGGLPPAVIGLGMFVSLMILLGVTLLTGGLNQRKRSGENDHSGDH